jgi:hypothetical protein
MKVYSFKEMLEEARRQGVTSEKAMWASIDNVSDLLSVIQEDHPELSSLYWKFMRQQHGIMYSNHYNETFAHYDVAAISYKNRDGERATGAHWTCEQIESATRGLPFPSGTNKWDKFVAFNAMYSDLCLDLDEEQIIKVAHRFYFLDDDWGSTTKIWEYFYCKNLLRD